MSRLTKFGDPLTDLELKALELISMEGLTYREVARRIPNWTYHGAVEAGRRIQIKLGARSLPHAVHMAMSAGLLGVYPNCGTRGGVGRHERYGEEICVKCRIFWRPYRRGIKERARTRARTETKISGGDRVQSRITDGSARM